jgi:hypothetical protein
MLQLIAGTGHTYGQLSAAWASGTAIKSSFRATPAPQQSAAGTSATCAHSSNTPIPTLQQLQQGAPTQRRPGNTMLSASRTSKLLTKRTNLWFKPHQHRAVSSNWCTPAHPQCSAMPLHAAAATVGHIPTQGPSGRRPVTWESVCSSTAAHGDWGAVWIATQQRSLVSPRVALAQAHATHPAQCTPPANPCDVCCCCWSLYRPAGPSQVTKHTVNSHTHSCSRSSTHLEVPVPPSSVHHTHRAQASPPHVPRKGSRARAKQAHKQWCLSHSVTTTTTQVAPPAWL